MRCPATHVQVSSPEWMPRKRAASPPLPSAVGKGTLSLPLPRPHLAGVEDEGDGRRRRQGKKLMFLK